MKYKASRKIIVMASIVFCAVFMFIVAVPTVLAVDIPVYQQLENIPGADAKSTNFLDYVHSIYRLSLWIVGISAMFMISVGGFMYLTSAGNTSSAASAKGVIKDALIGLLLGLSAWLLLNTINPDLTKLDVQSLANSPTGEATPSTPSVPVTPTGKVGDPWPDDADVRSKMHGVAFNHTPGCSTIGQKNCTSVYQLGQSAIDGVVKLKNDCNCTVTVTGGTEYWAHKSHKPGKSIVDIRRSDIVNYITAQGKRCGTLSGRPIYSLNGASYWDEDSSHFHVDYDGSMCK